MIKFAFVVGISACFLAGMIRIWTESMLLALAAGASLWAALIVMYVCFGPS